MSRQFDTGKFGGEKMNEADFPALYRCSDVASNSSQRVYLLLIKAEYGLLFVASILSMSFFSGATFYAVYAFVFVALMALLLVRSLMKPEQDWYKCRALAESVKTLTWRYVMRAAPFEDAPDVQIPRSEFRNHLHQLFAANRETAHKIAPSWSADDQISPDMEQRRALSLDARKAMYVQERVQDQRNWYARKAGANKTSARNWVVVGVLAYTIAIGLAISRIRFPNWQTWPIEPVIVFATSVIGWVQIKKYGELSAAYTVTAHEIGLIKPKVEAATAESALSDTVNEAELAFSREHTLWIARQTN